ncbi:Cytochrome c4 [Rhodovastum atsumiense]|uniref:Cytochrome c4 n=1 Tax=Rhodovastum atsumiense TaxID=504468 RepID=A0A5M6IYD7_9PROT|nr:c-type cytochrome [Rhodovastum atsumiense]KAA5612837.1 cytochrome c4 [Rhodovastum atsumiense]CAH2601098.1 Cytochrome c4 [Rhodovastum atsumiense]
MLVLLVLLLWPVFLARAAPGDVEAGRQKAAICATCHGEKGVSAMPGIPSLAGQTDQFLQWQLVFFRSGRRQSPLMSPNAAPLSDDDIRDLGAYFASLPRGAGAAGEADDGLKDKGRALAQQHRCAACHMDDFRGQRAAPAIANQREDYLAKALQDYRSAARPSVGVAAMTEAAARLGDEDIAALAHYLATLPQHSPGSSTMAK